jgi:hypothetical protein
VTASAEATTPTASALDVAAYVASGSATSVS